MIRDKQTYEKFAGREGSPEKAKMPNNLGLKSLPLGLRQMGQGLVAGRVSRFMENTTGEKQLSAYFLWIGSALAHDCVRIPRGKSIAIITTSCMNFTS